MNTITQTHTIPDGRIFKVNLEVFAPSPINPTPFVKVKAVQVDEDGNVLLDARGFPFVIDRDPIAVNLQDLISGASQALDGYVKMDQPISPESLDMYEKVKKLPKENTGGPVRIGDDLYTWRTGVYSLIIENVLQGVPAITVVDTLTPDQVKAALGLS